MLKVIEFKPHIAASKDGSRLTLTFTKGQLAIMQNGVRFDFVPFQDQTIEIDVEHMSVTNVADILVFNNDDRLYKMVVRGLMQMSDINTHLQKLICDHQANEQHELVDLFEAIEEMNVNALIDRALAEGNKDLFLQLTERQAEMS